MVIRAAEPGEVDDLARLWYDGWQDAHADIVPAALKAARTLESFRDRLQAALARVHVAVADGASAELPLAGFYMLKDAELYQFYVARHARGTGVAAHLIADAERRLADAGVTVAFLTCAIGNDRAARFYQKGGWHRAATIVDVLDTTAGPFPLEVWRYEKALVSAPR